MPELRITKSRALRLCEHPDEAVAALGDRCAEHLFVSTGYDFNATPVMLLFGPDAEQAAAVLWSELSPAERERFGGVAAGVRA